MHRYTSARVTSLLPHMDDAIWDCTLSHLESIVQPEMRTSSGTVASQQSSSPDKMGVYNWADLASSYLNSLCHISKHQNRQSRMPKAKVWMTRNTSSSKVKGNNLGTVDWCQERLVSDSALNAKVHYPHLALLNTNRQSRTQGIQHLSQGVTMLHDKYQGLCHITNL